MYQIIKVLNNNAILAYHNENERILLGKGIGFGKKPGEQFEKIQGAKVYALVAGEKQSSAVNAVNVIEPVYLEAVGRIIDEAEMVFDSINRGILLPLADHIAFAVKREKEENIYIPNPFIPDIKLLFDKEYAVAVKGREIIQEMTGCRISEDEVGFIALYIHSGLSNEHVSETLKTTRIIDESLKIIEEKMGQKLQKDSLSCIRLVSHLYYMLVRARTGEGVNIDLNDFMEASYPRANETARIICGYMEEAMGKPIAEEEIGFLAVHIQRAAV